MTFLSNIDSDFEMSQQFKWSFQVWMIFFYETFNGYEIKIIKAIVKMEYNEEKWENKVIKKLKFENINN